MILDEAWTTNLSRYYSLSVAEFYVTLGNSLFSLHSCTHAVNLIGDVLATFLASIQYNLKQNS